MLFGIAVYKREPQTAAVLLTWMVTLLSDYSEEDTLHQDAYSELTLCQVLPHWPTVVP